MERADDMEHLLFKRVLRQLYFQRRTIRIVENAFFAGACGTYIAAGIAAYTSSKAHRCQNAKSFFGRHILKLFNLVETFGSHGLLRLLR